MSSRSDSFDRADFERVRGTPAPAEAETRSAPSARTPRYLWPVENPKIHQSVLRDRDGKGTPHKGVDLLVHAGSTVRAARGGLVLRVVDGRGSTDEGRRKAGLFVDVRADDARIHRYLHLGTASVRAGQQVAKGATIGTVAPANTSGTGKAPHLHFEIRESDWHQGDYGKPVDPLSLLRGAQ